MVCERRALDDRAPPAVASARAAGPPVLGGDERGVVGDGVLRVMVAVAGARPVDEGDVHAGVPEAGQQDALAAVRTPDRSALDQQADVHAAGGGPAERPRDPRRRERVARHVEAPVRALDGGEGDAGRVGEQERRGRDVLDGEALVAARTERTPPPRPDVALGLSG